MLSRKASRTGRVAVIPLRPLALATAIACLALAAAGCGDSRDARSGDAFAEGDSSLAITLDPDGPDGPQDEMSKELDCEDGSKDPACQVVREVKVGDLDPVSPDTACTELFGGPDTASLEGTIEGEDVDVELTRSNGCEIERFEAALPLLRTMFDGYEPGGSIEG